MKNHPKVKTGLVLEGGGIRSSYLAGVLQAFHDQGFIHFDVVAGTSAGACCGANFIAGEPEKNRIILEDYLVGKRFVRLNKIFSKENIVDIDYLVDEVCVKHVPVNYQKIKNSSSLFYIAATDYQTGKPYYFNNREHNLSEALRASCAMPYLYRKKVTINDRRFIDGGMVDCIPVQKALDEGCKNIIAIGTRPYGYQKPPERLPLFIHRIFSDNPLMGEFFRKRPIHYNETMQLINNPPPGITIAYIAPKKRLPASRATREKSKIVASYEWGYTDGLEFCRAKAA